MKELNFLNKYIRVYRKSFVLGAIFVFISNICSTYTPRVVGSIIDNIKNTMELESIHLNYESIIYSILFIFLLTALSGLFMFLTRKTIVVSSRKIEYNLRKDFLESISSKPAKFFNKHKTGEIMALASNDISAAREFVGPAFMYGANTITIFALSLYFMISIDLSITLASLSSLPLIAVGVYFAGKKIHLHFKDVQKQFADLSSFAQETFSGIAIIRAFRSQKQEKSGFNKLNEKYFRHNMALSRIQSSIMPAMIIPVGISQLIVLAFGGYKVIHNQISIGELTQFFIYLNMLIWPVIAVGWITNVIQRASASAKRLSDIMQMDYVKKSKNRNISRTFNKIVFDHVSLKYEEDPVLKDINFSLENGEILGIVGHIGSGKSSIANLLLALYPTYQGSICIDDTPIENMNIEELRTIIKYAPQDTFLFSASIKKNITLGDENFSMDHVIEVCRLVELHDEVMKFPDGYDSELGERGISLSGGQKQRVAIARALIHNPQLLIMDDALSSIDTINERKIVTNIRHFMKNKTIIIISHRISTLDFADKIIVLDKGEIVELGKHEELSQNKGIYAAIYNMQKIEEEILTN